VAAKNIHEISLGKVEKSHHLDWKMKLSFSPLPTETAVTSSLSLPLHFASVSSSSAAERALFKLTLAPVMVIGRGISTCRATAAGCSSPGRLKN